MKIEVASLGCDICQIGIDMHNSQLVSITRRSVAKNDYSLVQNSYVT
jgi:hypothetical protein